MVLPSHINKKEHTKTHRNNFFIKKSVKKKERFILVHILRVISNLTGEILWQGCEKVGYVESTVRKQREINANTWVTLSI